jgi:preprotein translocase SecE subunit
MLTKVKAFWDESRQEFKRVNWPTFSETTRLTTIVVVFSLVIAILLGLLDTGFTFLLSKFVGI